MKFVAVLVLFQLLLLSGCQRSQPKAELKPAYNIPPLVGKRISEVEAALGPATQTSAPDSMSRDRYDGMKSWSGDTASLLVQYDWVTGRIKYFYLCAGKNAKESTFSSEDELIILGNLRRDASNYRLKFVPDNSHPGRFWAVKAIPNRY